MKEYLVDTDIETLRTNLLRFYNRVDADKYRGRSKNSVLKQLLHASADQLIREYEQLQRWGITV